MAVAGGENWITSSGCVIVADVQTYQEVRKVECGISIMELHANTTPRLFDLFNF
jgi:hypothetical protein